MIVSLMSQLSEFQSHRPLAVAGEKRRSDLDRGSLREHTDDLVVFDLTSLDRRHRAVEGRNPGALIVRDQRVVHVQLAVAYGQNPITQTPLTVPDKASLHQDPAGRSSDP